MNKEEIEAGNKLIAEWLGLTIITDGISLFDTNYKPLAKYQESWNDLMPVVEKIETIEQDGLYYNFQILGGCSVYIIFSDMEEIISVDNGDSKLHNVWLAVVEFIKWYNEQGV